MGCALITFSTDVAVNYCTGEVTSCEAIIINTRLKRAVNVSTFSTFGMKWPYRRQEAYSVYLKM